MQPLNKTIVHLTPPEGVKHDSGKLRWSLLPMREVRDIVRVLEHGAKKYSPDNWKQVGNAHQRYYDAAMRHLDAWKAGQVIDRESRLPHLAHAACCLLFLAWFDRQNRRVR